MCKVCKSTPCKLCCVLFAPLFFFVILPVLIGLAVWPKDPEGENAKNPVNTILEYGVPPDAFFDTKDLPWAQLLRSHVKEIREEWEAYERFITSHAANASDVDQDKRASISQRSGMDDYNNFFMSNAGHWKNIYIMSFGLVDELAAKHFPRTLSLVTQTPLASAMFSIMPANKALKPHTGEAKAILRYHLVLEAPSTHKSLLKGTPLDGRAKNMMKIRCGPLDSGNCTKVPPVYVGVFPPGVTKDLSLHPVELAPHIEGQDVLFDDTLGHWVANQGATRRVVLFCDLPRQGPWYVRPLVWTASWIVAPHLWMIRQLMEAGVQAVTKMGLETKLTPWYRHGGFLRAKYGSMIFGGSGIPKDEN